MNLDALVEAKRDDIVKTLQELIRIRSVERKGEGGYPFGIGVNECLEKVLNLCESKGFSVTNMDNMIGWCEFGQGEEMAAVLGHLDVVPEGDGWSVPPYESVVKDGRVYGRGAMDDKGPVTAALFALEALKESGLKLNKRIRIIFGMETKEIFQLKAEYQYARKRLIG